MKMLVLALFALIVSCETFAQRGPRHYGGGSNYHPARPISPGPRYNPPGTVYRPYRPSVPSVGPRYNPRYVMPGSMRYWRPVVRVIPNPYIGYTCEWSNLYFNRQFIHGFTFSSDCSQAVADIMRTSDFCDGADLYDQSGVLVARFTFDSECREALGYYY